jgi:translation initiation factor IF-3
LGITPVPEALKMARGLELDLVEVAPMANPPVCRIMDYGKFRYEEAQKAKESRRKSSNVSVKEVKFRPKIGRGDFDVKVRKVDQFIHEGHKVKVTLQFRGREMAHPELGTKILDQVLDVVGTYVKVETQARLEGRNMSMVLSPDKTALAVKPVDEDAADIPAPNGDVSPAATETPVVTAAPAEAATVAAPAPAATPAAESPAPEPATATEQTTP